MQFLHIQRLSHRLAALVGLSLLLLGSTAHAQATARTVPAAVTVAGHIAASPSGKPVQLTVAALETLPQHSFTTNAPWTHEPHTYTGVLLRVLLSHLGASGTRLEATALNDYAITIPLDDARHHDVLVAYKVDGKPIAIRERGPLLVMYPFDSHPELQSKRYYERAIWQLKTLTVQ